MPTIAIESNYNYSDVRKSSQDWDFMGNTEVEDNLSD